MKQLNTRYIRQQGFTLIEVMVVVIILGILAAVVVPNLVGETDTARINAAKHDIQTLESMLDRYKMDNFQYPTTDQGLEALVEKPNTQPEPKNYKDGGYIKKLPKDPWGNPYEYLNPGVHGQIDIFSKGPDANSPEDDIGNWNS